jgi:L-2-hydroxyglutarate oxidase LhgO
MYDVIIIGAGVSGCAIARELTRYDCTVCVVEREEDVCCGTSKANSAIVHAGFDAQPGTLMGKLNAEGNRLMYEWAKDLNFAVLPVGSLVVCVNDEDRPGLQALLERGEANGVPDLRIIERDELVELEPNISDEAVAALWAPTGGIVDPFGLTVALAENAAANGAEFKFDAPVTVEAARAALETAKSVVVDDDPANKVYPMPGLLAGCDEVHVGRLRNDPTVENGLAFWCVMDQIRKGAALNAVQIAQLLVNQE